MAKRNIHPEDLKATIRKTGLSVHAVGERAGIPGNTVCKSLYVPCPKGNRVIAAYLGRKLNELWPEWYDTAGNRLPSRSCEHDSRADRANHGQKRQAA